MVAISLVLFMIIAIPIILIVCLTIKAYSFTFPAGKKIAIALHDKIHSFIGISLVEMSSITETYLIETLDIFEKMLDFVDDNTRNVFSKFGKWVLDVKV